MGSERVTWPLSEQEVEWVVKKRREEMHMAGDQWVVFRARGRKR